MWLFGWTTPGDLPDPAHVQLMTPTQYQSSMLDGFEPERYNVGAGRNQKVTIIIYDDTHFRVKK